MKNWWFSFSTTVFLLNRVPSSVLQFKSPYEVAFKVKFNPQVLKCFGCACFPHLRAYNRHKLELRSSECVFIGYSNEHKGYRCLHSSGRVYIAKSVVFNESSYPYQHGFPDSTKATKCNCESFTSPIPLPFLSQYIEQPYTSPSPVTSPTYNSQLPQTPQNSLNPTLSSPNLLSPNTSPSETPSPCREIIPIIPPAVAVFRTTI